jgi:hypothetical protein
MNQTKTKPDSNTLRKIYGKYETLISTEERSVIADLAMDLLRVDDIMVKVITLFSSYQQAFINYNPAHHLEIDIAGRLLSISMTRVCHSMSERKVADEILTEESLDLLSCEFIFKAISRYQQQGVEIPDTDRQRSWATLSRHYHSILSLLTSFMSSIQKHPQPSSPSTIVAGVVRNTLHAISDVSQWKYLNLNNIKAILKMTCNLIHHLQTVNISEIHAKLASVIAGLIHNIEESENEIYLDMVECLSQTLIQLASRALASPAVISSSTLEKALCMSINALTSYHELADSRSFNENFSKLVHLISNIRAQMIIKGCNEVAVDIEDAEIKELIDYYVVYIVCEHYQNSNVASIDDDVVSKQLKKYLITRGDYSSKLLTLIKIIESTGAAAVEEQQPVLQLYAYVLNLLSKEDELLLADKISKPSIVISYERLLEQYPQFIDNVIITPASDSSSASITMIAILPKCILSLYRLIYQHGWSSGLINLVSRVELMVPQLQPLTKSSRLNHLLIELMAQTMSIVSQELSMLLVLYLCSTNIHLTENWTSNLDHSSRLYLRRLMEQEIANGAQNTMPIDQQYTILRNHARDINRQMNDSSSQGSQAIMELERSFESSLSTISRLSKQSTSIQVYPIPIGLRYESAFSEIISFFYYLYAKLAYHRYHNLQLAYRWSRKGFAYAKASSSNRVQLDLLLLMIDICDQLGQSESLLAYAAEAISLKKACSDACLHSTLSLHLLRIWTHLESKHAAETLAETQDYLTNNHRSRLDEISCLNYRYLELIRQNRILHCKYRYLNHIYYLQSDIDQEYVSYRELASSSKLTYISTSSSSSDAPSSSLKRVSPVALDLLHRYQSRRTMRFSDVRSLRRIASAKLMTSSSNSHGRGLQAFILGAASCNVSLESNLDTLKGSDSNDEVDAMVAKTPYSRMTENASIVQAACFGDADSMQIVKQSMTSDTCFITIEPSQTRILLGRYFAAIGESLTMSIHVGDELMEILEEWEMIIRENDRLLQMTMDVDQVKNLNDKMKRQWWSERQENDKATLDFLLRLQEMFGSWLWLLTATMTKPKISSSTCSPMTSLAELRSMMETLSIEQATDRTSSKKKATKTLKADTKPEMEEKQVKSLIQCLAIMNACEVNVEHQKACIIDMLNTNSPQVKREELDIIAFQLILQFNQRIQPIKSDETEQVESASESSLDDLTALKIIELRQRLKELGLSAVGKKEDLISRLKDACSKSSSSSVSSEKRSSRAKVTQPAATAHYLMLILDEKLQAFPWERMPALQASFVGITRIPSLVLLLSMRQCQDQGKSHQASANAAKSWYLIDPENNLANSRETMHGFLRPYIDRYHWSGYVGKGEEPETLR